MADIEHSMSQLRHVADDGALATRHMSSELGKQKKAQAKRLARMSAS